MRWLIEQVDNGFVLTTTTSNEAFFVRVYERYEDLALVLEEEIGGRKPEQL